MTSQPLSNGNRKAPKVWMTEGGVNYKFNCKSIRPGGDAFTQFCNTNSNNISLLGMRRQAQTMSFLLKTFADRERIKRVYYYHLINTTDNGECNENKPKRAGEPFHCPLSEFGLLGASDDNFYAERTKPNTPNGIVVPKDGERPIEPNNNHYSYPGERRFSFCLLRDRKSADLRKPKTMNRSSGSCPAGP